MTWEAKFVGRENELRLLKYGIEQANEGRGSILFITGEAGVGKTRLVEELGGQELGVDTVQYAGPGAATGFNAIWMKMKLIVG